MALSLTVIDLGQDAIFVILLRCSWAAFDGLLDMNLPFEQLPVQDTFISQEADEGIQARSSV